MDAVGSPQRLDFETHLTSLLRMARSGDVEMLERLAEGSPTGTADTNTLPKVEGDDEANDSVCVPPPPVDLIGRTSATSIFSSSFSRCMTRTARCLDHSASELKSIYKEGYEEVRNRFPRLWSARLDVMLTEYCDLIKI